MSDCWAKIVIEKINMNDKAIDLILGSPTPRLIIPANLFGFSMNLMEKERGAPVAGRSNNILD
jgi:hypothetical protein